jgi:triosephosphate isomerase
MRRKLVAGNWKMQGRQAGNAALLQSLTARSAEWAGVDMWVAPPAPYLLQVVGLVQGGDIAVAAQNVARENDGAYTGEISAGMLLDCGCKAVILGHSERRTHYGETDALVAEKFVQAQCAGLVPVLCVGETLAEREAGATAAVVQRQLEAVLQRAGAQALAQAVVAYEPVWAIGTGRTASPEQAQEVHALLRARVAQEDAEVASCGVEQSGSSSGS